MRRSPVTLYATLPCEPRGERDPRLSLMQDEHRPCALQMMRSPSQWPVSPRPSMVFGRSWIDARSLMVSREAAPVNFTFKKADMQGRPTPGETIMLRALRAAIRKSDREVGAEDAYDTLLEGARYVTGAEWREEFRTLYKTGSSRQAESQAFAKGRDGLIAKGFVGNQGSCYWPTVMAPS
jgi:hypothetical protein